MTIEVRPATPADIEAYAVEQSPYRVRALVGLVDGVIVAIGGVAYLPNGTVLAFMNLEQEARERAPVTMLRVAKQVVADAHARGVAVINALCDESIEAAPRFLRRLGFREVGEGIYQHEAR